MSIIEREASARSCSGCPEHDQGRARRGPAGGSAGTPPARPLPAWRASGRAVQAFYASLLLATVAAALLPAVMFQPHSRIFLLKVAAIVMFASLPGLLYVQFVRFKGQSLYDEYVINLFRLKIDRYCNLPAPPKHTSYFAEWLAEHKKLADPGRDNLYRRKFETVYGEQAVSTRELFADPAKRPARSEGLYPVVLATALLSLGWAVVVQPELYHDFNLLGHLPFSGQPHLPYTALQFGFIGAYWFILQDLTRRYFRQDLKTAAYVSASVRLIVVTITVATVALIPVDRRPAGRPGLLHRGVSPDRDPAAQGRHGQAAQPGRSLHVGEVPAQRSRRAHRWDQARLLEEGIEDVHALATANLVDLLLGTRVPANTLIDWLDQALLCLSVPQESGDRQPREGLRMLGIRTATDLIRVWDSGLAGGPAGPRAHRRGAGRGRGDRDGRGRGDPRVDGREPQPRACAGLPGARLAPG